MDDTKMRITLAAIKAVRQYGLEGVRVQNISKLASISPGAIYRYFVGKTQLLEESFTYVDKQAAALFEQVDLDPQLIASDPMGAFKALWLPYFRFWTSHPDETVFYHRFRDSITFPQYDKNRDVTHFDRFVSLVHAFMEAFPALRGVNQDLLWMHVLTSTVMFAKYVVEGTLPDTPETEETVFRLLTTGLSGYLMEETP